MKNSSNKVASGLVLILLAVSILSLYRIQVVGTNPTTITVPDDYPTIQEALNSASEGDSIFVRNGTYHENVVVNKPVSLIGENKETTIIDGSGNGDVVWITQPGNVTLSGFTIRNSGWYADGVRVATKAIGNYFPPITPDYNTISDNLIMNSFCGIFLEGSTGNNLRNNTLFNNRYGLAVWGNEINDIDTSNTVDGKPIYYLINQHDLVIDANTFDSIGYLGFVNSRNITIKDLRLSGSGQGIFLGGTTHSKIENVTLWSNWMDILLCESSNNTVLNNSMENSETGIYIVAWSEYNSIVGNEITNEYYALDINHYCNYNTIVGNTISGGFAAFGMYNSGGNRLYHNNFYNTNAYVRDYTFQAVSNYWDDGYPSGGNYWSNYAGVDFCSGPYQNETGSDGMGDTPYAIDANNQDNYPLMIPWSGVHDVAVTNVTTCKDGCKPFPTVGQNWTIHINVTVENRGDSAETFNTNVYANATMINQTLLAMPNAASTVLAIEWNATLSYGNYTISAYAEPVAGEISTGDNNLTGITIHIGVPGDINGDGMVELQDFFVASQAFGSWPSLLRYNPTADINNDGIVEMMDFFIMSQHYLEHYP
jgi:parallel beta-helix repeat protein